jgi:FkbM family methyltransferase
MRDMRDSSGEAPPPGTPIDVLYVTCVDLGGEGNGGALCCRNHVRQLAADPGIRLQVAVLGPAAREQDNRRFAQGVGVGFHFIAFHENPPDPGDARLDPERAHLFPWERTALVQSHVGGALAALVAAIGSQAVVLDYLPTALFAGPLLAGPLPVVLITLQDERKFFRDLRLRVQSPEWSGSDLAEERWSRYEQSVYAGVDGVVALRSDDLAPARAAGVDAARLHVVSPIFPEPAQRWRPGPGRSIFFVGNHHHFPNRAAIDWLCLQFAPHLRALDATISLRIIGASADELPSHGASGNVQFLGAADREAVQREFLACGLFIAPVALDYGCEIKLQECAAHATPFVATATALEGMPELPMVPLLRLEDPAGAARLVGELLGDLERRSALGDAIAARMAAERQRQHGLFGAIVREVLRQPRPRQGRNAAAAGPLPASRSVLLKVPFSDRTFSVQGSIADKSVVGAIARSGGSWEPEIMDVMQRFIRPDDVCLDIGANVGVHTLAMAALAPRGRVHAFEPSSVNFRHLGENIRCNAMANARAWHFGLSDAPGERDFHYFDEYAGCSVAGGGVADIDAMMTNAWGVAWNRTTETVAFTTLDLWADANALERLDFVKMDVEGFERFVIEGGMATFRRFRPKLVTEFNRKSLNAYYGIAPASYFDLLRTLYDHIYIVPAEGDLEPVAHYTALEARLTDARFWADLLCVTEELRPEQLRMPRRAHTVVIPAQELPSQAPAGSAYYASFGPYLPLDAGRYTARFTLEGGASAEGARMDACCHQGSVLASRDLAPGELAAGAASLDFLLPAAAPDVEVRLLVPPGFAGRVEQLEIVAHAE